jgi:tetratricopeptide (TPR) repeat protein
MASAILAYDDRQLARAQQDLDTLFGFQKVHAAAAVLRGRIALEEGNLPFAQRFLAEHVKLSPDDADLREVYAGALYLAGKIPEAKKQLMVAANLGAPAWRVAYHQGLFEEAAGNFHQAFQYYEGALKERPDWDLAMARRSGITAATYKLLKPARSSEKSEDSFGANPAGLTLPTLSSRPTPPSPRTRLREVR